MSTSTHPTSTPAGSTAPGSPSSPGFELKRRRRWPVVAAVVGVLVVAAAVVFFVVRPGAADGPFTSQLKVGFLANDASQQALLEFVDEKIAPDYDIEVVPTGIGDPNQLSEATNDGTIAATIYAHKPWIEQTNAAKGWDVTPVEPVFQWAYSMYSSRYPSLEALPDGATIALLDDPANTAQALMLLAGADLITLDPAVDPAVATLADVVDNPHGYTLQPIAFGSAARSLGDIDAIISYNFEFVAAGIPTDNRIYAPDAPVVFAAQLAVGAQYLDDPNVQKLVDAFADPRVQEYLATTDDPAVKDQLTPVSQS
jgi:D-methionine transport system substrate-binding protein